MVRRAAVLSTTLIMSARGRQTPWALKAFVRIVYVTARIRVLWGNCKSG